MAQVHKHIRLLESGSKLSSLELIEQPNATFLGTSVNYHKIAGKMPDGTSRKNAGKLPADPPGPAGNTRKLPENCRKNTGRRLGCNFPVIFL